MRKKLRVKDQELILFCEMLSLLISCGVPILDTFSVFAEHLGLRTALGKAIMYVRAKVAEGKNIAGPMREAGFPSALCQLVFIGESTGALDVCLRKYADVLRTPGSELKRFCMLLALCIDRGLPLVTALDLLAEQFGGSFGQDILKVKTRVDGGATFANALRRENFDKLFCAVVAAGEVGGILDTVLNRFAEFVE